MSRGVFVCAKKKKKKKYDRMILAGAGMRLSEKLPKGTSCI